MKNDPILTLKQVSYHTDCKDVLRNVSFTLNPKDHLTLIGPSGIGKSTLLLLIAKFISPTKGFIEFKQQNIQNLDSINYRRSVSYCFQNPTLFGEDVLDNLKFPFDIRGLKVDHDLVTKWIEKVNLNKAYLHSKITELSGGQRQRIALIRNLIFEPDILLIDEVTTGLDSDNKNIIHGLIKDYRDQGGTVIQITHDETEIGQSDRLFNLLDKEEDNHA